MTIATAERHNPHPHIAPSAYPVILATLLSGDPFEDGHDGDRYTFEAGQPVALSFAAAQHMFGVSIKGTQAIPSEARIGQRFGLALPLQPAKARDWLKNWKFEVAQAETKITLVAPEAEAEPQAIKASPQPSFTSNRSR